MKPENKHTKHNIARLVKRTRPDQRPPEAFTDGLIDAALQALDLSKPDVTRSGDETTMKRTSFARIIGYAATVLLIFGLSMFFFLPRMNKAKQQTRTDLSKKDNDVSQPEQQVMMNPPSSQPRFIGTPSSQTRNQDRAETSERPHKST